jgi:hypothetical protein
MKKRDLVGAANRHEINEKAAVGNIGPDGGIYSNQR